MDTNRYTVERHGKFYTVERVCWSAAAVVAMKPHEKLTGWEVIKDETTPHILFEVTGTLETGYILANGNIKVYRHKL